MHVLVQAAHDEDFVVVAHWLGPEEFLRLLERAFHPFDLTALGVEREAVRNPSIISSKNQDLLIVKSKATHGISG